MSTAQQYRAKAAAYAALAKTAHSPSEHRELTALEHNFTSLAANEEWLAGDVDHVVMASLKIDPVRAPEEQILQRLGAAVVMLWDTLPKKIRRELLDHVDSIGGQQPSTDIKEQIECFLTSHGNNREAASAPLIK